MDANMMKRFLLARKNTLVLKVSENWGHTKATIGEYQLRHGDIIKFQFPNGVIAEHTVYMCSVTKTINDMGNVPYDVRDQIPYVLIEYNGMEMSVGLRHFKGVRVLDLIVADRGE